MIEVSGAFDDHDAADDDTGADDGVVAVPVAATHPVHDPHDNLWVAEGDRVWDLGPADLDTDADGVADSLTRVGPDGMTVYTDSDHDGQVDAITEVDPDGGYSSQRLDPDTGTWVRTDLGRLG